MSTDPEFITPPNHVNFRAKKLFGDMGHLIDGAIAYLDLNGGGPTAPHTHDHNHLFIVVEGEAKVQLGSQEIIIRKDEAFLVEGRIPHAVWNASSTSPAKILGLTLLPETSPRANQ